MDISKFSMQGAVTLILVLGAGIFLLLLFSDIVPKENSHFFDTAAGAWLAWTAQAIKRTMDGSASSDQKNEAISNLSAAVITAQAQPASDQVNTVTTTTVKQ